MSVVEPQGVSETFFFLERLDAPVRPQIFVSRTLEILGRTLEPCYKQQCHLENIKVSRHISGAIEAETQLQSECQLWTQVRKPRLTASRFGEICHVRGESSAKALVARILRGTPQTAAMKRGLDLEPDILKQYYDFCDVSVMQCGIIIHPDAPHFAASPDVKVFNPR